MELSWSTFLLEVINFLVLVWILKHFLYKPVLDVIARRRSGIENQLAEARELHDEANALKAEYENRLADWDKERQQHRDMLAHELDEERARQMASLRTALAQEREKAQVAESRRLSEAERDIERHALQHGTQFATKLLTTAACPELEARLAQLVLDGLSSLSEDRITALRTQWGEPPESIQVSSAFPLPGEQRNALEKELGRISGLNIPVKYDQDSELLAGLRITIGAWILQTNLKHELKDFAEFAHVNR